MCRQRQAISIHAPREGSDAVPVVNTGTPVNFNPRSPRGERPPDSIGQRRGQCISIHAPREGSDGAIYFFDGKTMKFQSTLPARGATTLAGTPRITAKNFNPRSPRGERLFYRRLVGCRFGISIHAPREGSDVRFTVQMCCGADFNPRSPRGERLRCLLKTKGFRKFQSTLPARGATL